MSEETCNKHDPEEAPIAYYKAWCPECLRSKVADMRLVLDLATAAFDSLTAKNAALTLALAESRGREEGLTRELNRVSCIRKRLEEISGIHYEGIMEKAKMALLELRSCVSPYVHPEGAEQWRLRVAADKAERVAAIIDAALTTPTPPQQEKI